MAIRNRKKNSRSGLLNSRLGRAALIGGAAWATTRYFMNRSKKNNSSIPMPANLEAATPAESQDNPSQTGQWSANPGDQNHVDKPMSADNMPGDTEIQRETWQRY